MKRYEAELLSDWMVELGRATSRRELIKESELREQCAEFLRLMREALQRTADPDAADFGPVRDLLARITRTRGLQGFTPSETASFVFSFKQPLFSRLRREVSQAEIVAEEMWTATQLLDRLGLFITEVHLKAREEIINRQQQDMLELSTPVVMLWDKILALPLIGTLDSNRTQTVMEALLQRIVETGSEIAIIDITGVPTVDTLTAQHLLKTVTATRLMGADCIISGIRPQIAQTIVHLGVNLGDVLTKASLASAFRFALQRTGQVIHRAGQTAKTS
ncbi:MAG TPA: STAS domain-containing protein [Myxococcaceae bacterium]|nr:STAS domain-containing protein [Myxococcaceae bacterium]